VGAQGSRLASLTKRLPRLGGKKRTRATNQARKGHWKWSRPVKKKKEAEQREKREGRKAKRVEASEKNQHTIRQQWKNRGGKAEAGETEPQLEERVLRRERGGKCKKVRGAEVTISTLMRLG